MKKNVVQGVASQGRILARVFADDLSNIAAGEVESVNCGAGCEHLKPPPTIKLNEDSW